MPPDGGASTEKVPDPEYLAKRPVLAAESTLQVGGGSVSSGTSQLASADRERTSPLRATSWSVNVRMHVAGRNALPQPLVQCPLKLEAPTRGTTATPSKSSVTPQHQPVPEVMVPGSITVNCPALAP